MERITLMVAVAACLIASVFTAATAFFAWQMMSSSATRDQRAAAITAMDAFDARQPSRTRAIACLQTTNDLDKGSLESLFAGATVRVEMAGMLPTLGDCRRGFQTSDVNKPITLDGNDTQAITKGTMDLLGAYETLFAGVKAKLNDCTTIDARFGPQLAESKEVFLEAIARVEEQNVASYPAFTDYLKNGCR